MVIRIEAAMMVDEEGDMEVEGIIEDHQCNMTTFQSQVKVNIDKRCQTCHI